MINSYNFGRVVIDGRRYANDVIILRDRIVDNWWRKEGHRLDIRDLSEVLPENPEILVVGTGHRGLVKIPVETHAYIASMGIDLVAQRSKEACETYNQLKKSGRDVVAALHLSC
jgi:hypothetical protein